MINFSVSKNVWEICARDMMIVEYVQSYQNLRGNIGLNFCCSFILLRSNRSYTVKVPFGNRSIIFFRAANYVVQWIIILLCGLEATLPDPHSMIRYIMKTLSVLLAFCEVNPTVIGGVLSQRAWALSQYKDRLSHVLIFMVTIRRSRDCIIFNMGISILVRDGPQKCACVKFPLLSKNAVTTQSSCRWLHTPRRSCDVTAMHTAIMRPQELCTTNQCATNRVHISWVILYQIRDHMMQLALFSSVHTDSFLNRVSA